MMRARIRIANGGQSIEVFFFPKKKASCFSILFTPALNIFGVFHTSSSHARRIYSTSSPPPRNDDFYFSLCLEDSREKRIDIICTTERNKKGTECGKKKKNVGSVYTLASTTSRVCKIRIEFQTEFLSRAAKSIGNLARIVACLDIARGMIYGDEYRVFTKASSTGWIGRFSESRGLGKGVRA